jgi:hypothetical protein
VKAGFVLMQVPIHWLLGDLLATLSSCRDHEVMGESQNTVVDRKKDRLVPTLRMVMTENLRDISVVVVAVKLCPREDMPKIHGIVAMT